MLLLMLTAREGRSSSKLQRFTHPANLPRYAQIAARDRTRVPRHRSRHSPQRQNRRKRRSFKPALTDLVGKGGHIRTVPMPGWVKAAIDCWLVGARIDAGPIFRAINKAGRIGTGAFSPKVIWGVVKSTSSKCGLDGVAPHDLPRTCARLCHEAGGELEQIQFLLGHVSVQTTEQYLGCKQRLRDAVNDRIGLEPDTP